MKGDILQNRLDRKISSLPEEDYYLNMMKDDSLLTMKKEIKHDHNRCTAVLQALEGKTIQITALNIDVVNSSERIRILSSDDAAEYYQTFIESTADLIHDYGGYVLKNIGDCVMGFFPCSKYIVENHDKALLCGLAMSDMIKGSLDPYFVERNLPSIACRISADFGAAKVLRISSNGGYSAIDLFGSAMNSASKISHLAKPNQMVIGGNLYSQLIKTDDFDFKSVSLFDLSGKRSYPVYLVERKT